MRSLHPGGELLEAAHALASEIAENTAPVSVALARQLMWRMLGAEHPMLAHRADSRGMVSRGQSADAVEGMTAFLEKRPADFPDRVSDGLPDMMPGWGAPAVRVAPAGSDGARQALHKPSSWRRSSGRRASCSPVSWRRLS